MGQRPDHVRRLRPRLRAAVPGDRRQQGARRPRPALQAADLQLPPGHRRDDRQGQGLLGRRHGADLPEPRRPRPGRRRTASRSPAADEAATVAQIKAAFLGAQRPQRLDRRRQPGGLEGHRPGLHQGRGPLHPERPGLHGRHGAPDAHRRPRRVLLPAVPVRRRDAGHADRALAVLRPARLRAGRAGPRQQHQHAGDVPRRRRGRSTSGAVKARSIDLAPTLAFLLGIPEPQYSQGRSCCSMRQGHRRRQADLDRRAQRLPRPARPDHDDRSTASTSRSAAPASSRRCSTRTWPRCPGTALLLAGGDNVGASPPNSALLEDMPAIDVENAWGLDATSYGNHEFDYGVDRGSSTQQAQANFPFLATNIVETATGQPPSWVKPSMVFNVNGVKVGVIGAELQNTPELVAAGNTAGLTFLPEADAHQGRVGAAAQAGRQGPGRGHPRGHERRDQHARQHRRARRGSARSSTSPTPSRTRPSTR